MTTPAHLGEQFQSVYETDHGMARVTPSGYVSNVSINVNRRGQGHGTELMSKITEHADALGQPLTLNARPDLHPWYKRMGFAPTGNEAFGLPELRREKPAP